MSGTVDEHIDAIVTRQRELNVFGELSQAHRVLLENARELRDGWHYECLSCNVIGAFKVEAFLNHLGFRLLDNWKDIERRAYDKKLDFLTKKLKVTPNFGCRPYNTLGSLFFARNAVAHGKHAVLSSVGSETGSLETLRRTKPLSNWETLCTIEFVERVFMDTEQIADLLWIAAGYDILDLRSRGHSYAIKRTL